MSESIRKSYILQYAPDGARRLDAEGRPAELQNDPLRQYEILRAGRAGPVA